MHLVLMTALVFMAVTVAMPVTVIVVVVPQQPDAREIDQQSKHCDRNRLTEVDRHGREKTQYCFVPDDQRDHGEHDGAGEAREIAQLARTEYEAVVSRVPAGVGVR